MTGAARTGTIYGLLRIRQAHVALPLTVLREVIPCPGELAALPVRTPGLLGAVHLRDMVIPVLDLAAALGWPEHDAGQQVIVVISAGGRLLGIVADQVNGITTVQQEQLHATSDTDGGLVLTHTFARPEDGTVVSVLDAEAIVRLPGLPTVQGSVGETEAVVVNDVSASTPALLVRSGPFRLAVRLVDVHTVLPQLRATPSALDGELCRGVTSYLGRAVPVVDLLRLVGLRSSADTKADEGLLWQFPDGFVALQVTEVVEIVDLAEADVKPLPALGVPQPQWFRGAAQIPGFGQYLVLDPATISRDEELTKLGRLNTFEDDAAAGETAPDSDDADTKYTGELGRYLVYQAHVEVATPLDQVTEIVPYPADMAPIDSGRAGLLGLFTHGDQVVPLVCLNRLAGSPAEPDPGTSRVLLIGHDGDTVGFVVSALRAIEQSVWEEDPDDRSLARAEDLALFVEHSRLVQIGAEPDTARLLPRLDLVELAETLSASV